MSRGEHEFQWNLKGEPEADSVLNTLASLQKDVTADVRAGEYLVEIGSALEQLQTAYPSASQRAQLASHLRVIYLYFQRLAAKVKDKQLHAALIHYLGLVGSLTLTPEREGETGEPFTFLEALATNEVAGWVDQFYDAFHEAVEQTGRGRPLVYRVDSGSVAAELTARRSLMHNLETE